MLAERRVDEIAPLVPAAIPVYALPQEQMNHILGMKFHSGVIACGSGRAALEVALRATGVRDGGEVIVPTFCCTSVVAPILAVVPLQLWLGAAGPSGHLAVRC